MNVDFHSSALAESITALRERNPLVQCLTNHVVMNFTANVLYAVGASPAMCDNPEEAAGFATQVASGVLVNNGTPSSEQIQGMYLASAAAVAAGNSAGSSSSTRSSSAGSVMARASSRCQSGT